MTERFEPAKTVFFDMDGVIAGFEAHAIHRVETMRPGFTADAPRAHFYIADDYPDYSDDFRYVSASPGFFRELPVLDGVFDAWQSTIDAGWQPRILSSPLRSNPTC